MVKRYEDVEARIFFIINHLNGVCCTSFQDVVVADQLAYIHNTHCITSRNSATHSEGSFTEKNVIHCFKTNVIYCCPQRCLYSGKGNSLFISSCIYDRNGYVNETANLQHGVMLVYSVIPILKMTHFSLQSYYSTKMNLREITYLA